MKDLLGEIESHARGLGRRLGGEEGVENLVDDALFDTDAVVVDLDQGMAALRARPWRVRLTPPWSTANNNGLA